MGSADTLPPRPEPKFRTIIGEDGKEIQIAVGEYYVGDFARFGVHPPFLPRDAYSSQDVTPFNAIVPLPATG